MAIGKVEHENRISYTHEKFAGILIITGLINVLLPTLFNIEQWY